MVNQQDKGGRAKRFMDNKQLTSNEQLAEEEIQLAIARRRAGLCIHYGRPNADDAHGQFGGSCEDCVRDILKGDWRNLWVMTLKHWL